MSEYDSFFTLDNQQLHELQNQQNQMMGEFNNNNNNHYNNGNSDLMQNNVNDLSNFYSAVTPDSSDKVATPLQQIHFSNNLPQQQANYHQNFINNSNVLNEPGVAFSDAHSASDSSLNIHSSVNEVKSEECMIFEKHLSMMEKSPVAEPSDNIQNQTQSSSPILNGEQDPELEVKKKEQNRAAQRAFRQRKEAKLKELELKLSQSETDKQSMESELNLLRKQILEMSVEKKYFQQQQKSTNPVGENAPSHGNTATATKYNIPSKTEFQQYMAKGDTFHEGGLSKELVYQLPEGDFVMTIPATWEFLQEILIEKEIHENKTFDISEVMKSLKGNEKCHGHGAAYLKSFVLSAVDTLLEDI